MNRLTKQYKNGSWTLDASQIPPIDQAVLDSEIRNSEAIMVAVERLVEYEDEEEKGLLVHLPCKVGDTVWTICAGMAVPAEVCMIADKGNGWFVFLSNGKLVSLPDIFLTPEGAKGE